MVMFSSPAPIYSAGYAEKEHTEAILLFSRCLEIECVADVIMLHGGDFAFRIEASFARAHEQPWLGFAVETEAIQLQAQAPYAGTPRHFREGVPAEAFIAFDCCRLTLSLTPLSSAPQVIYSMFAEIWCRAKPGDDTF